MKLCFTCGKERELGRTRCRVCYLTYKSQLEREKYLIKGQRFTIVTCKICNKEFKATRKTQINCPTCYKESMDTGYTDNKYVYLKCANGKSVFEHRHIAEVYLNRKLTTQETVHHINMIESDNALENLIIMDRRTHGRLHCFLRIQRLILQKQVLEQWELSWKNMIKPVTLAWLETTNVRYLKLWEEYTP